MTEAVIFALLFAWFKGYKWSQIAKLFKHWSIYPIILTCLIHIYFISLMIHGQYWFLEYGKYVKLISVLFYFILILKYNLIDISVFQRFNKKGINQLYTSLTSPVVFGGISTYIGSKLNKIAILYNCNKMPVFPSVSFGTGYSKIDMFEKASLFKDFHVFGGYDTKLIFLTDVLDFFYVIMSVGDLLLRVFVVLILYYSIKQCNINNMG